MHIQTVVCLEPVVHLRRPYILRLIGQRIGTGRRNRRRDLSALHHPVTCIHRQSMRQKHMIIHLCPYFIRLPGVRLRDIHALVHPDHQVLLIVHQPPFYPVPERLKAYLRIALKGIGAAPVLPAVILFHQRIGQVKVIQGHKRKNIIGDQFIDHLIIKINPLLIYLPISVRNDPRPGNGKTISFQPQLFHQGNIFFPVMVKITCHLTVRLAVRTFKGIEIRHRHSLPVRIKAALDLERRRSGAPEKMFRKFCFHTIFSNLYFLIKITFSPAETWPLGTPSTPAN